ncbi:uncharacterized protein PHA67_007845 [Liasis olivaceus]
MVKRTGVLTIFLAVSFFQIGIPAQCQNVQAVQCYKCTFGQACLQPSVETCKEGERCGTIRGLSDFKVHESIFAKGCIPATACNEEERVVYANVPYRIRNYCCNTSFCNGNSSGAAHTSVTSFFLLVVTTTVAILLASFS